MGGYQLPYIWKAAACLGKHLAIHIHLEVPARTPTEIIRIFAFRQKQTCPLTIVCMNRKKMQVADSSINSATTLLCEKFLA